MISGEAHRERVLSPAEEAVYLANASPLVHDVAKEEATELQLTVLSVEQAGIEVDVYGLRVRVENPYLAGMELPDARRYFRRGDELRMKVVEVDSSSDHLVVSNVGTDTDPKMIVDAFAGQAADTVAATTVGYRSLDGLETGIRIAFDETRIEGYITRRHATRSRFVPLSEKFPLSSRVGVKVLAFRSEYNTWACEMADLHDPWDTLPEHKIGDTCDVCVREIAEQYVICELAEGVEGTVFPNEIAWGSQEDRLRTVDDLKPGQRISARILDFDRANHILRLSFKRTSLSPMGRLYSDLNGDVVSVEVIGFKPSGASVRFQNTDLEGFLPVREVTWGYCGSVEAVFEMNQIISVRPISYREDWDSIAVSAKAARTNDYETLRGRFNEGDTLQGAIWAVGTDIVYVDLDIGSTTAAGFVHISEVSNWIRVTPELLKELMPKSALYTFTIKRFDDVHRVVQISRRRWLQSNYTRLDYGVPYRCRVVSVGGGKILLYGNDLERKVPGSDLVSGKEIEVFVARKGESERDLDLDYGATEQNAGRRAKRTGRR
jgi:ribosomal protein S1